MKDMRPNYRITTQMLNLVQRISVLTTELSFEKRELHLRKENRIRSIQSSLAIENNSLTLEQVTGIIAGNRVLGPPKDIHEVQNAYEAYERVFKLDPYDVEDFLLAHYLLTHGLVKHPGRFRSGDVGVYDSAGTVVHIGTRPQFVPELIRELFQWASESQTSDIVKSCIVHFELEIIHPFEDGNGRMGRLWQSLILSKWNRLFEWVPIESVIYEHQQVYYDALTISNTTNDSTAFIEFLLQAILETLENYKIRVNKDTVRNIVTELKPRELELYQIIEAYLKKNQQITNSDAKALTGLSAATARRYLKRFVDLGLLQVTGSTRDRVYKLK